MEQQYDLATGTLGRPFDNAEVLTVSLVKQILYEKMADMRQRSGAYEASSAYQTMQRTKDALENLEEFCAADADVAKVKKRSLRLRGDNFDVDNAHLANLEFDDDGNPISTSSVGFAAQESEPEVRQPLKQFEIVQLATLVPRSVEEAVSLVPSLAQYNAEDLLDVLQLLAN